MAKPGIDTSYLGLPNGTAVDCNAGYSPLGNVTGISMTHVSGTGGVPTYGLISQMPLFGDLGDVNLADNTTYWQNRSFVDELASVGLFKTKLLNGIAVEVASSNHSGLMRYTFPSASASVQPDNSSTVAALPYPSGALTTATDAHVLVDLTHVLPGYGTQSYSQRFVHGNLHLRTGSNGMPSYSGSATYTGGWSQPDSHTLFFCGNFSSSSDILRPTSTYVMQNTQDGVAGAGTFSWPYNPVMPPASSAKPIPRSYNRVVTYAGSGMGIGALFSWTAVTSNATVPSVLEARVGISYISAKQACSSLASELPDSMSFEDVVEQAKTEWEEKVLSSVEIVDDGSEISSNETLKRMLYTALYQTGLMPTDKTGENPRWQTNTSNPYFDEFYTLWDTYRTLMPLYHLLYTRTYSQVLSGLISIFTHEGFLPAGRIANWNGRVQGGTHADMVLADAFVKDVVAPTGQRGGGELGSGVDWEEAYHAVLNDADVLPVRNEDPVAFDGATKEGRGALDEQLRLHFITRNHTRSISRGVEYPQNDFAIWSMAKGLNRSETQSFRDRADWWQNQWNPHANTSLAGVGSFTGFPGARNSDGSWNFTSYDPLSCGGCGWGDDIYEAKVWETAFSAAPHDMAKVVEFMGGDETFLDRLDASFLPGFGTSVGANNDAGSALFNPGNEPSFMTPYLYNYVPKHHWKTVNQTRAIIDTFYSTARNGYPGNIDGGALPSWLVFSLIGLVSGGPTSSSQITDNVGYQYPVAAQPIYLLGGPRFSSLSLRLFAGTTQEVKLNITALGLSDTTYYPQSVTLNGQKLDRSWITHAALSQGGSIVFEMGSSPSGWDDGERPPSLSPWGAQDM
ncbi:hypothetical protein LTR08_003587 [Meristemomyces frigidus]|nr:hypothetical protein LTR08_003587 [Meristemomyces frigidus]